MSLACGMECVMMIACSRWIWKRCTYIGSYDSKSWPYATPDEFSPIPRMSRLILAVYEDDLNNPHYLPPHHSINPDWLIKRVTYSQTLGHAPPYIIYLDHHNKELVVAIRGLNLVKESDYKLLLDNKLGMQMFDGGYVHHGLLRSAIWLLNEEGDLLRKLWLETGKEYDLVFAGHSLGSGVAALATVVVANHRDELGGIPRSKIKCYALAPARSMSLNLAVKYADIIHSVILQDDFLPRTSTPLEYIFESIFCLPCLLFWVCVRDTFIPEGRKLRDPRRLYAPGRMYHIVERKFCRCGRFPPEVRTAIPVEGRFEHIVLSCNATSDHGIIWIEREAEKALKLMTESSNETATTPPQTQKFKRSETFEDEHIDALRKAVSLNIPHAVSSTEDELRQDKDTSEKVAAHSQEAGSFHDEEKGASETKSKHSGKTNWDEAVQKLFRKSESGEVVLKQDIEAPAPQ
ncbi:hypothetical protein ACFE04_009188 [Oxalis oulophora]